MKRLALFSSFFESDNIPAYVFYFLSQMRPHVACLIYITTDNKTISPVDMKRLLSCVDEIVQVENGGYDFGMWNKVLNAHSENLGQYDELCLVNDSCVCFSSLSPYFAWHEQSSADVTGITLSYDVERHLQSFFLCVKKSAFKDVVQYLRTLDLHHSSFEEVIESGELGLSRMLHDEGFSIKGFFEKHESDTTNPTYSRCIDLIGAGVPLIKKKIFLHYYPQALRHLLERRGDWRHRVLLEEIQHKANLSDQMMQRLFDWYSPRRTTLIERVRIMKWWAKHYLGKL